MKKYIRLICVPIFCSIVLLSFAIARPEVCGVDVLLCNLEVLAADEDNYYANGKEGTMVCNASVDGKKCKFTLTLCEGGGKGCKEKRCPDHDD